MIRAVFWLCLAGAFREPITLQNWGSVGDGAIPECLGLMVLASQKPAF